MFAHTISDFSYNSRVIYQYNPIACMLFVRAWRHRCAYSQTKTKFLFQNIQLMSKIINYVGPESRPGLRWIPFLIDF